jgi:WD40 repeat protein
MSPDQEHRLEEIFSAARELPALERTTFLDRACGGDAELRRQADSLLAAHEQAGPFLQPTVVLPTSSAPVEKPGDHIGRYKLLEQIGEGGFGVVWMAEQEEPVRRRVALKIIKLGMDTKEVVARFEAERQALAMMDHPHIASVFDGGATDTGRPYFVMELVKGVPITNYCDVNQLSTRERLDLFMQVCHAVQHAHQKGVIHRDLKPSNILVTVKDDRPVPKVIDFGVAKATQARLTEKTLFTRFQQWIGTPAYMSPEQAGLGSLDVDTRSDIYSLGVLLYELLTGRTPFDTQKLLAAGYDAVMRTIREEEPPKPSTRLSTLAKEELGTVAAQRGAEPAKLGRLVRGDLDWIVMKALEKDRTRRYETASGLAADLQRHLGDEPVTAMAPALGYQLLKFARRHRAALATVCALLVVLAAGAGVSAWQAHRASQQARSAEARRVEAETSRQEAGAAQARAERSAREASRLLTRQYEREGIRLLNDRDLTGSLVYFTEALRRDEGDPDRARWHRLRIALVLSQCPDLKGLLVQAGNVITARFTADGSEIISAANIREDVTQFRVWETAELKPVAERVVEADWGRIILSPNGGWIATYDRVGLLGTHTVGLWDVRQRTPGRVLFTNSDDLIGLSVVLGFSQDDHRVVLANAKEVRVWDTTRGQPVGGPLSLSNDVIYAALSADGMKLALCVPRRKTDSDAKGEVLLLNAETLESLAPPLIHDGLPFFAGFDATGQRLITTSVCTKHGLSQGSEDAWRSTTGEARVWDARSGQPLTPPLRHDQPVYQAELSPDGLTLVTAAGNPRRLLDEGVGEGQMHFWNVSGKASPERSYQTLPLAGLVTAKFASDGQRVLVGRNYEVIEPWWNWEGKYPPDREGFSLALGGGASGDFRLKVPHADFFVCFSPDGHRCLVSNKGRALQVWQLRTSDPWTNQSLPGMDGRPLHLPQRLAESVIGHRVLLMGSRESPARAGSGSVIVVDTEAGTVKQCIVPKSMLGMQNGADVSAIWRFSPDGQRLGMCRVVHDQSRLDDRGIGPQTSTLQVAVWRSDGGDPLFAREARQDGYVDDLDAVFDRPDRFLLALWTRGGVRVSNGQTGVELKGFLRLEEDREETDRATFSADGSRLLIEITRWPQRLPGSSASGTVGLNRLANVQRWLHIWRLEDDTHTEIPFLKLAGEAIETECDSSDPKGSRLAAVSSDARRAVVKSGRNRFRIWNLESESPLTPHVPLEGSLLSAELSRDGKFLLTLSQREKHNHLLQLWHAESGDPLSPPLPARSFERLSLEGRDPVAVVGYDESKRWSLALAPNQCPVQDLVRLAQWLAGRHLDASGALTELDVEAWQALGAQVKDPLAR